MSIRHLKAPALALGLASMVFSQVGEENLRELVHPPFVFRFPEPMRADVLHLAERGGVLLPRIALDLGASIPRRIDVRLQTAPDPVRNGRAVPDWAAGFVPRGTTMIVIVRNRLGSYPLIEIESVFLHELTHVLFNFTLGSRSAQIPRWFEEGVAMLQSRRWGFRDAFVLSASQFSGTNLPLEALATRFPSRQGAARAAYAQSFSFMGYLTRKHGEEVPRRILGRVREGIDFPAAFHEVTGRGIADAERAWRESVVWKYRWIPILTSNGLLFSGIGILFLLSYLRKKRQTRRTLESWRRFDPPDLF